MSKIRIGIIVPLIGLILAGCTGHQHRQSRWLSYDQVIPQLRRAIRMQPDQYAKACGHLLIDYPLKTAEQLRPRDPGETVEEIILTDVSARFYDRRTAQLVAECGFWVCRKDPRSCRVSCPDPPGWSCE
jgi:hypothetical protein